MSQIRNKNNEIYNLYIQKGIKSASLGDYNNAKIFFKNAIKNNKKRYEAYINLSNIYIINKEIPLSLDLLFSFIDNNNFNKEIINHAALICLRYKINDKLDQLYKISKLDKSYNNIEKQFLFYIRAKDLEERNKFKEATKSYEISISLNNYHFESYISILNLFEKTNNINNFEFYINKGIEKFNNEKNKKKLNTLIYFKSLLFFRKKKYLESEHLINKFKLKSFFKKDNFYLSKILDLQSKNNENLKNFSKSYKIIKERNILLSKLSDAKSYDKNNILGTIDKYKEFFTKGNVKNIQDRLDYTDNHNLVFLVGFPRSGTTLLDTILRSHSKIKVLEEKPILLDLRHDFFIKHKNNLHALKDITQNEKDYIKEQYFKKIFDQKNTNKKIIIDKLPLSIIELGFIKCIFPESKIILALRHPCDVITSCIFSSFKMNDAMINFLDLKDAVNFYDKVMRLFENYDNELDLNYISVKYEDVVSNFKREITILLNFLNLKYEKKIENFFLTAKKREKISTPSYNQVIKPIYKSSINRWKNYSEIKKSKKYLNYWIKKFNY